MTLKQTFGALVCAFMLVSASFSQEAKYDVVNCWDQGVYVLRQDGLASSITTLDKKVTSREQYRNLLIWRVEAGKAKDDVQVMKLKLTRLVIRFTSNNEEKIFFDSSSDRTEKNGWFFDAFAVVKNREISIDVKNGQPCNPKGYDADFWKTVPPAQSERDMADFAVLRQLLSDDNLIQLFELLSCFDASEKVGKGDEWKSETPLNLPDLGEKKLVWDCVLDSVAKSGSNTIATVRGEGELSFDANEKSRVDVKMDGEVSYSVDQKYPIESVTRVTATMERVVERDSEKRTEGVVVLQKNNLSIAKR